MEDRCGKCGGVLYFDDDLVHGTVARRCLSCGGTHSYLTTKANLSPIRRVDNVRRSRAGIEPPVRIVTPLEDDEDDEAQAIQQRGPSVDVSLLNLSARAEAALREAGVDAISDLIALDPEALLRDRNFGHRSYLSVVQELRERGIIGDHR